MNIRQAATASGLTVKTVRYYDDIGIMKAGRQANGYRDYSIERRSQADVSSAFSRSWVFC